MARISGTVAVLGMVLLVAGCTPFMVPLREVDDSHTINNVLNKDEVRAAIMEGAEAAGWRAKDWGDDKILVSYMHTQHTVHVEIDYSDSFYITRYHSSNHMKMFCTEQDKKNFQAMMVSGRHACPGDRPPAYIHKSYKEWLDQLNQSIQFALDSY